MTLKTIYYGNSVLSCVKQAVDVNIPVEILVIISPSKIDDSLLDEMKSEYRQSEWKTCQEKCIKYFDELWSQCRIIQPRVYYGDKEYLDIRNGARIVNDVKNLCTEDSITNGGSHNKEIINKLINDGYLDCEPIK